MTEEENNKTGRTVNEHTLCFQGLRDPEEQLRILKEYFPHLQFDMNLVYDLELPLGAEEFLLLPDPMKLWDGCTDYDYYPDSVKVIMDILRKVQSKKLCMSSGHMLDPKDLERGAGILAFYEKMRDTQTGDIFMVPVKIFGYSEMSAQAAMDAIERSEVSEIGFGAYEYLIAYLTHMNHPPFLDSTVRANCLGDSVYGRKRSDDLVPSITFREKDFGLKSREKSTYDGTIVNFTIIETDIPEEIRE